MYAGDGFGAGVFCGADVLDTAKELKAICHSAVLGMPPGRKIDGCPNGYGAVGGSPKGKLRVGDASWLVCSCGMYSGLDAASMLICSRGNSLFNETNLNEAFG